MADFSVELNRKEGNKETRVRLSKPKSNTIINFPAKVDPGTYTIATLDDTTTTNDLSLSGAILTSTVNGVSDSQDLSSLSGIPEAPIDNNLYGRKNANWAIVPDTIINNLLESSANTMLSTVNGSSSMTPIIRSIYHELVDKILTIFVNGLSTSIDLSSISEQLQDLQSVTNIGNVTSSAIHNTGMDNFNSSISSFATYCSIPAGQAVQAFITQDPLVDQQVAIGVTDLSNGSYLLIKKQTEQNAGITASSTGSVTNADLRIQAADAINPQDLTPLHQVQDFLVNKADLVGGLIPASQLPSYVDEILSFPDFASFPQPGDDSKIYLDLFENKTYRWTGSSYVQIDAGLVLGETASTAFRGDQGKIAYDHSQIVSGNPHNVTKAQIGLSNVDNTSDVNKPISNATQTALNGKQDTLTSGVTIKTINSTTLLGNGNILIDKVAIGLSNVDNTSDINKPISTATQSALDLKEILSNKQNSLAVDASNNKYPTVTAVNTGLALKANDNTVVHLSGNESIAGIKTFTNDTIINVLSTTTPVLTAKSVGVDSTGKLVRVSNEAGSVTITYTGLTLSGGFTAGTVRTFDINAATPTITNTNYPNSTPNSYSGVFDNTRGSSPTGRLIENPVVGQEHLWRIKVSYANKDTGIANPAVFTIRLRNPVSGFVETYNYTASISSATGTFTALINTTADNASIPSPNGYVLDAISDLTDNDLSISITSIKRISLAVDR